jgi:hypothetical protein
MVILGTEDHYCVVVANHLHADALGTCFLPLRNGLFREWPSQRATILAKPGGRRRRL